MFKKGQVYLVTEPLAYHFNDKIIITKVSTNNDDDYCGKYGCDVYYRVLYDEDKTQYGFGLNSIFSEGLMKI